jgi:hypothetical protein
VGFSLKPHAAVCVCVCVCRYYLYLNLTRSVLDIFNCQPTTPPDGREYLRTCRVGRHRLLLPLHTACSVSGGFRWWM